LGKRLYYPIYDIHVLYTIYSDKKDALEISRGIRQKKEQQIFNNQFSFLLKSNGLMDRKNEKELYELHWTVILSDHSQFFLLKRISLLKYSFSFFMLFPKKNRLLGSSGPTDVSGC